MGRVTQIQISGDNDPPLHPVKYEMHYFYCDHCGSFDMELYEAREGFSKKIKGVRCNNCGQEYELGSPFFTRHDNPRAFTMADVPRPLNKNYYEVGSKLGPVDDELE
ncbi:MAG: hypothetical protein H6555_05295 [Lewinellaceae bacterium]|nr:hypothetical protein [Lewinellaceae bacterium]